MTKQRFESRYNSRDGEYWLFDNKYDSCLLILNSDIQLHNLIIFLNQMNEENKQLKADHKRQENQIKLLNKQLTKIPQKIREVWIE